MKNKNFRTTLILSALVAFAPMSIDMYLPALPALERYFATDPASVQHTLASFFVGLAIGQLFYGPIADRYGRKSPLYFGLTLYAVTNVTGLVGILVPLFFVVSLRGLTFPNASAGAMAPFPGKAGSASALLGSIQFAIAAIASAAVGILHNGTAVPMAGVITVCGLLAFVSYRWLALKHHSEGR